ncbi:MAG: D-alanyl-D-alanine carboxypeptidase family protein [Selenomonadaceae bacterium]|nr:D-alanyl-D-alanine carboxypeptidase family protein [Selenomonadaceae bacterium]
MKNKISICLAVIAITMSVFMPYYISGMVENTENTGAVNIEKIANASTSSTVNSIDLEEPNITADYAILIEAATGRVIYEKNADEKAYPASTTKMLTCVLAIEKGDLDKTLSVSQRAAWTEDPYVGFQQGDMLKERDLLKALMMVSDNSSAVVLAEGIGGSVEGFAKMMNDKAKEIGLTNSHFVTPNGLPDDDHYSTARDMAKIAAYGWHNEKFREFSGTEMDTIEWVSPVNKRMVVKNSNKLLGTMPGVNGIKTGWTNAAGGCLAASAKRDGVQLIAVVLHSDDVNTRFTEAGKLLEYGFSKVKKMKSMDKSRTERTVLVSHGEGFKVTAHPQEDVKFPLLQGDSEKDYTIKISGSGVVEAPIEKGQRVGQATVYYKGKKLNSIPMVADKDVYKGNNVISILVGYCHRLGLLN